MEKGKGGVLLAAGKRFQAVILNPFAVILSEALDRPVQGVAKDLRSSLKVNSAKNLGSCKIKQLQGSFVVPIRSGLLRMTAARGFSAATGYQLTATMA